MKFFYQIKTFQWMKWRGAGFSFPEIMITLGLMVLLAGIASPVYLGYKHDSIINKMIEDSSAVRRKIDMCFRYAELHDCVDTNKDGNCDHTERFNARWEACTGPSVAKGMVKLGLIPCLGSSGAMNVSSACNNLQVGSNLLCVTLEYKGQQGCVRYDASGKDFTVCVDPEDPNKDTRCAATCDPKKGYKCSGGLLCVCA